MKIFFFQSRSPEKPRRHFFEYAKGHHSQNYTQKPNSNWKPIFEKKFEKLFGKNFILPETL